MNFDLCQKLITSLGFSINWKKTFPRTTADNILSRVQNQLNQHDSINLLREAKQLDSECNRLLSHPLTRLRNLSQGSGQK